MIDEGLSDRCADSLGVPKLHNATDELGRSVRREIPDASVCQQSAGAECRERLEPERGCQQLVDMGSPEGAASGGLNVLLRRVRKFFDCHEKPFLNATSISGQAHTFKSPTTRLKERFVMTEGKQAFFYSYASRVGTC